MPTNRMTVRWSSTVHRLVREAAEREGVSVATYVRVAVVARIAFEMGAEAAIRDGDADELRRVGSEQLAALAELLDRYDDGEG